MTIYNIYSFLFIIVYIVCIIIHFLILYNYGLFRRETSQLSGLRSIITRGRQPEGDNTSQT